MSDIKAKLHKIRFSLGLRHRPRWGSLQRSPRPVAVFKGPTSKGRAGEEKGKGEKTGREEDGEVRKGKREGRGQAPKYFGVEPPLFKARGINDVLNTSRRYAAAGLDFTEARDSEWRWHQLGHMQDCTSLQTDNHASTPPLSFYRPDALPAAQPTASKH